MEFFQKLWHPRPRGWESGSPGPQASPYRGFGARHRAEEGAGPPDFPLARVRFGSVRRLMTFMSLELPPASGRGKAKEIEDFLFHGGKGTVHDGLKLQPKYPTSFLKAPSFLHDFKSTFHNDAWIQ